MNKKLDIIFRIDEKEVTEKELENHFIQNINELIEKIEAKKIPLITKSYIICWIVCVIFIIVGLISWILFGKPFDLIVVILFTLLIGATCLILFGKYQEIITFKVTLQDAKKSDKLLIKVDFFAKAIKLYSKVKATLLEEVTELHFDIEATSELKDFDFNLIHEFLNVQDINRTNILEYSFGATHGLMFVTYAEEDGLVKTSLLRVDKIYESIAVTNNILICTDKELICIKSYFKKEVLQ